MMVVPPPPFCSYRWEVEQTSEDFVGPGNKLADNPTHLTPGKAMKPLRVWFWSAPCQQDFFFLQKKVWIHCSCRDFFVSWVLLTLAFSFICCFNLCFAALQETEIQGLQKMKRVSVVFLYNSEHHKLSSFDAEFSQLPLSIMCVNMFRSH